MRTLQDRASRALVALWLPNLGSPPTLGWLLTRVWLPTLAWATALVSAPAHAQVDEPLESPQATVSQVVGVKAITIAYFSPGVKERAIWGELVPYGQNWRAGANGKTTFTFEEPVVIEGVRLEAGTYGFYVFPASENDWQLVLNSNSQGSPNEFLAEDDVVRVSVQPQEAPFRERLLYSIENFSDWPPFVAELVLHWEKKKVSMRVAIAVDGDPDAPPPP